MPLTFELPSLEEQTEFNLRRWEEITNDSDLAKQLSKIEGRIETDRHGNIILMTPPGVSHGGQQFDVGNLLHTLLPAGRVMTECPISTVDGVKAADVVWMSPERWRRQRQKKLCLTEAPEICVEILSPSNKRREIEEKRALYFGAGAREVWICASDGKLTFYLRGETAPSATSKLCPAFPKKVKAP